MQDTPLFDLVFQTISKSSDLSIPFSEYMETVLYHPELGYYAPSHGNRVGRNGDFFTSVSVGETFGLILAHRIHAQWHDLYEKSSEFIIVEQGANDGALAIDILAALREVDSNFSEIVRYYIVEPREGFSETLVDQLSERGWSENIEIVPGIQQIPKSKGIFLCNELLDAFPFNCVIREGGVWTERRVGIAYDEGGLRWKTSPLKGPESDFFVGLEGDFPEGYRTEYCPGIDSWMQDVAKLFDRGEWWIIDYGYEEVDYYSPERTSGTMRCYRNHRATENPFEAPGEIDITAHVNFSRVERSAKSAGLKVDAFTDQHHFLIDSARPWLHRLEGKTPDAEIAKKLRQFQTLTHPSMMGQQFKVMTLSK